MSKIAPKRKKCLFLYLMKKAFQNSFRILMAFLVLLSTVSFTVDKHFCGAVLVDQAVWAPANTCGMEMDAEEAGGEDSCCSNEKQVVDGQDELKRSPKTQHSVQLEFFIAAFTCSYSRFFEEAQKEDPPFKSYVPPLLVTDIQIRDQVYLI